MVTQVLKSFPVTLMQSISPELLEFTIGHLFGFFNLSRTQLNLSWIHSSSTTWHNVVIWFHVIWINITIVVVVVHLWNMILGVSSSLVLLSNSTLELCDGSLFQLLPHLFFFFEPCVLCLTLLVDVVIALMSYSCFCLHMSRFCIARSCHVKHKVVEIINIELNV